MNDDERADFNNRIDALKTMLADVSATHKRAEDEHAANMHDRNELLRVSQIATISAKTAAEKASLAANFSLHAAQKAINEKPIDAAEICVESSRQSAEAAAQAAIAATNAAAAVALAIAHGEEQEAARLAKVAADAAATASAASSSAAFLAREATEFVRKAREKR
jgi:hypothetical protein